MDLMRSTRPPLRSFTTKGTFISMTCRVLSSRIVQDTLSEICCLWGFTGTPDKATAGPAKYLMTALQQAANFLATLQTEWAGAQAFSSFDTYMAPFIRVDEETGEIKDGPAISYKKVKQAIQTFLFCINVASRWGQCPFSNVTMDLVPPKDLADSPVVIGGKHIEGLYYKDFQVEMDMFNKAFLDLMLEGDSSGKALAFSQFRLTT